MDNKKKSEETKMEAGQKEEKKKNHKVLAAEHRILIYRRFLREARTENEFAGYRDCSIWH